jgi:2-hydroxychromene-2-carboxylate isomerase
MHMADRVGLLRVRFLFDFGSPNAYLAAKVIPDVEKRTGVSFEYVPVLLGGIYKLTGNSSPADYLKGIRNKREYMEVETERFIRRHGITSFRRNPFFPVNTLQLMRGAVAAQAEGLSGRTSTPSIVTCGRSPRRWTTPR